MRESQSQVTLGSPLLLCFSSLGELLWPSEVDQPVISKFKLIHYPSVGTIRLHYNELVGSRTGRSLVARREESPNSAEQCAG
jgi:hypothetical protein